MQVGLAFFGSRWRLALRCRDGPRVRSCSQTQIVRTTTGVQSGGVQTDTDRDAVLGASSVVRTPAAKAWPTAAIVSSATRSTRPGQDLLHRTSRAAPCVRRRSRLTADCAAASSVSSSRPHRPRHGRCRRRRCRRTRRGGRGHGLKSQPGCNPGCKLSATASNSGQLRRTTRSRNTLRSTGTLRLGAGRSQVQILSPRSRSSCKQR
jgi:hypothetical protein